MRDLIELTQQDITEALAAHFAKKRECFRAKATLMIVGLTADGQGTVKAIVERVYDTETDPY